MWRAHMSVFVQVYRAKFAALEYLERGLTAQPFTGEKTILTDHRTSSKVDQSTACWVAVAFAVRFIVGLVTIFGLKLGA